MLVIFHQKRLYLAFEGGRPPTLISVCVLGVGGWGLGVRGWGLGGVMC